MVINGNIYVPETPHFFQVIMPHALQLGKLEIPITFARKYGGMSFAGRESVRLVVPNGDTWTVGVEKSSDKVMLGQGWKDFMEHYSLGVGSFVTFRFEPVELVFAVLIFDQSSIEINYLPKCPAAATTAHLRRVKIKKEIARSDSESSDQDTDDDDDDDDQAHLQNLRTPFKGKSGNPSFRMRIQPSYLKHKSRVTLPHAFVMKNKLNKKLKVKLRLLGYEKIWKLGIFYRKIERRGELSNAGWHKFCRETGIRVNDHCEFELTSRVGNKVFFTVSIIA